MFGVSLILLTHRMKLHLFKGILYSFPPALYLPLLIYVINDILEHGSNLSAFESSYIYI